MVWVVVNVLLAVAGLAVLAVLGWRLWRDVRVLGRAVTAAADRLNTAVAQLEAATRGQGRHEVGSQRPGD
ncbi:hypothetical protein [Carbonactinospora thermoautotrophica]|uniref:hypothetical protein n=1 Tax=Carbonactinospora thermoautotrophica TaxID=1469144 RepID=UPI00082A2126|nr:hypothetical protein [Carbonactinospora thermoautotrophica]